MVETLTVQCEACEFITFLETDEHTTVGDVAQRARFMHFAKDIKAVCPHPRLYTLDETGRHRIMLT